METSSKHIIFHISSFWTSKMFRFCDTTGHAKTRNLFLAFVLFKTCGFVICLGNIKLKNNYFSRNPKYEHISNALLNQTYFGKVIDFPMNRLGFLVSPNRSGFPTLFGKKRELTMVES